MNTQLRALDLFLAALAGLTIVLGVIGAVTAFPLLLAIAGITLTATLLGYPIRWAAGAIIEAISRRDTRV